MLSSFTERGAWFPASWFCTQRKPRRRVYSIYSGIVCATPTYLVVVVAAVVAGCTDRPQKSFCTAAELQKPGCVPYVKTATKRDWVPATRVTRCKLRDPENRLNVPAAKSRVRSKGGGALEILASAKGTEMGVSSS